jgi:hypothetical protein
MVGYGKDIVTCKYTMDFLPVIDVWSKNVLATLKRTKELYSQFCVWVEKEGIKMVEQEVGSIWIIFRSIGQTFQLNMVGCMT